MNNEEYQIFKLKWKKKYHDSMLDVLKNNQEISIFNAQKSLYIPIKRDNLCGRIIYKLIKIYINTKRKELNKHAKK